jgi:hypothetical protein
MVLGKQGCVVTQCICYFVTMCTKRTHDADVISPYIYFIYKNFLTDFNEDLLLGSIKGCENIFDLLHSRELQ